MPASARRVRAAMRAAIEGTAVGPRPDPAGMSSRASNTIAGFDDHTSVNDAANENHDEYVEPAQLLADANEYFSELGAAERKRFKEAHRRIREMKAVNRKGGDKDGFKYVIPKSVKALARELDPNSTDDLPELANGFAADAAVEIAPESHEDKPMKRKKRRGHVHDDYYQVQVWKKWTNNAEKFLSRGKMSSRLMQAKGQDPSAGKRRGPAPRNALKRL